MLEFDLTGDFNNVVRLKVPVQIEANECRAVLRDDLVEVGRSVQVLLDSQMN